jgi:hypothetical protein
MLAAEILASEVSAAECLRLAARPDVETATARRGHTPAASMKKLAPSEFRDLQRLPAEHEKSGRATPAPLARTESRRAQPCVGSPRGGNPARHVLSAQKRYSRVCSGDRK